ncbi:MAG TPA: efflux RND transporter periplasmic adaptor subunit [Flavobacteriales bacterium]
MKKLLVTSIIIIAALGGIFYVLNKNKAKNQAQIDVVAQKNAAVAVRSGFAEKKELNIEYVANGVFAPKQEVMIAAETAGRVVSVLVQEGAHVSAGQTLAVIESDKQNVGLANAQAVYNNALAEVARFESAYATGGVTKQQLDQVKLQLENAKNNLKSAQLAANDVIVKASFAGIVNSKKIEPGATVNFGQQMFEIVNVSSLKIKVNVDEKHIGGLKLGQEVKITTSVMPDKSWTGNITFIAPKADASLNFVVEVEVKNNADNDLKAGMYGTVTFGSGEKQTVFVIPRTAFVGNVSSNKVFVIKDGKAILTQVVSGRNFGDYVEVISGLNEGDEVVVTGQINLLDGMAVEVIK